MAKEKGLFEELYNQEEDPKLKRKKGRTRRLVEQNFNQMTALLNKEKIELEEKLEKAQEQVVSGNLDSIKKLAEIKQELRDVDDLIKLNAENQEEVLGA
jgi:hypothetical protein